MYSSFRCSHTNRYEVILYFSDKKFYLDGYLDTGNQLSSPFSHKPVLLVNLKIPLDHAIYIPFKALNSSGVIPCVKADKVYINHKEFTNCLIGISKDKFHLSGCSCILPNQIKEDL